MLYLLLALLSAFGSYWFMVRQCCTCCLHYFRHSGLTGLWQGNVVLAACITYGIRVLLVYGKAMLYLLLALLSTFGSYWFMVRQCCTCCLHYFRHSGLTCLWQGNVVLATCITFGIRVLLVYGKAMLYLLLGFFFGIRVLLVYGKAMLYLLLAAGVELACFLLFPLSLVHI